MALTPTGQVEPGAGDQPADAGSVYKKFVAHIHRREKHAPADLDIRDYVDHWREALVSVGFPSDYLKATFGINLLKMFPSARATDEPGWGESDHFLVGGSVLPPGYHSHPGCVQVFETLDRSGSVLLMDTGYLASVASWTVSFRGKDPRHACLGYVYDDIAHYFMSNFPGRIVRKLNSPASLSHAEEQRAQQAMDRIIAERISKYNNQPFNPPVMSPAYRRRVLVVDQSFADASTIYGLADEDVFQDMLLTAVRENPDAEIIVKTHPDSLEQRGRREGFYSGMTDTGRVRFLRRPVNPFVVFDVVDTVYVATSQMGFEAVMAGKKVVCFGAPVYAGWGFTDDRRPIPHRDRKRSIVEFFHYFYIWYTRYYTPDSLGEATIEEVLDYIVRHRPHQPTPSIGSDTPEVSVVIPVHGVEQYIEDCLASIQAQTLKNIEIIPVNDCSPDGSQDIIDQLAADDPRIAPIVLKENVGQGFARNRGIEAARGEFILFVDGDDYLRDADLLLRLVELARRDGADMVRAGKSFEQLETVADGEAGQRPDKVERYFESPLHGVTLAACPTILHNRHFWNFLYRRDFLASNNIRFTMTQWEERPFLLKALISATAISASPDKGFVYRVRSGSTARRPKSLGDVENQARNFAEVVDLFVEQGAADPSSPLNYHFRFTFSQYIQTIFFGFPYGTVKQADKRVRDRFLQRWSDIIRKSGLDSADLTADPDSVDKALFAEGVYALVVEAMRKQRFDLVESAAALEPLRAAVAYRILVADDDPAFVAAVNGYVQHRPSLPKAPGRDRADANPALRTIIHAGASKTGSSFIQHFLDENRPALLRQGIWAPEFGVYRQPGRPHKIGGHSQFFKSARRDEPDMRVALANGLALLGPEIHTVIISSEGTFLGDGTEALVDYLEEFNPELLVYFRRQDDWANSQYAEFAGGGALGRISATPEDWLATRWTRDRLDYEKFLRRWMEKLPKEKIHVRAIERSGMRKGEIYDDFVKMLGADPSRLVEPAAELRNELKLSKAQVEAIRSFNALPFPDDETYLRFVQRAHDIFREGERQQGATPSTSILTPMQRREILAAAGAGNAWIAREFMEREDGALFSDLAVDEASGAEPLDLRASEMAAIVEAYNDIAKPRLRSTADPVPGRTDESRDPQALSPVGAATPDQPGSGTFVEINGRRIEKRLRAIRGLPNSQIAALGLVMAEGHIDPRKLDAIKRIAANKKMSKRRLLTFVLRRYGNGVLRADMPALDRITLLLRG